MTDENVIQPEEPIEEVIKEEAFESPEIEETIDQPETNDLTSDDKIWAALGYPIPIIAIIALLMDEKKERPFIKYHAVQSLIFNIVLWVLIVLLSIPTIGCISILWLATLWPAYEAYKGKYLEIPVISNFMKNQGWV